VKQLKPVAERADNQYGALGHRANHARVHPLGTQIGPRHLSGGDGLRRFGPLPILAMIAVVVVAVRVARAGMEGVTSTGLIAQLVT